ncbi:TPA: hypothetical protein G8M64_004626 [Salmonella enterica]|nr:hypothetical protein [Salmonella enterica]
MRIIAPVIITILLSACVSPTRESYGVKIKAPDHAPIITVQSQVSPPTVSTPNVYTPTVYTPTLPKREIQETVASRDGRYVYYTSALWDGEGREPTDFSNYIIGVYDMEHEKKSTLLTTKHSTKPEKELSGFNNLILSPDNNTLYFHTDAWITSPAIYKMDLKNYKPHYIVDGYLHCIVQTGKYKGDLIVSQHRHYVQGGSYNPISLFTPQGKKLGVVGDDDTTNAGIAQLCNHVSEFGMN